jgi:hypothetical protein
MLGCFADKALIYGCIGFEIGTFFSALKAWLRVPAVNILVNSQ